MPEPGKACQKKIQNFIALWRASRSTAQNPGKFAAKPPEKRLFPAFGGADATPSLAGRPPSPL